MAYKSSNGFSEDLSEDLDDEGAPETGVALSILIALAVSLLALSSWCRKRLKLSTRPSKHHR